MRWVIITGEYPPQLGGVGDYTRLVARELAAVGDKVDVWTSDESRPTPLDEGVSVHRLSRGFGLRGLLTLHKELKSHPRPFKMLIQYVPHMYGWRAMNLPLCVWLYCFAPARPWVMFHEVAFPFAWNQSLAHNFLGAVNHVMATVVTRAAEINFIAIPRWSNLLQRFAPRKGPFIWLPVPSNVATCANKAEVESVRAALDLDSDARLLGHFGNFESFAAKQLRCVLGDLLERDSRYSALFVGRGSQEFEETVMRDRPSLAARVRSTGELTARDVATHLKACDILIQPYLGGVSSRRGSLMAGLALGLPIVTTLGSATEPLWIDERLVMIVPAGNQTALRQAVELLAADDDGRHQLAARAHAGYAANFGIQRTIDILRSQRTD